jgi:hypothetical protein
MNYINLMGIQMNLCKECLFSCKDVSSANICDKYVVRGNWTSHPKYYYEKRDDVPWTPSMTINPLRSK